MDKTRSHRVELSERRELKVYGVIDVHSFNEEGILLETTLGILTVGGNELSVSLLNLDSGEVSLRGEIESLCYSNSTGESKAGGLLSRLFK